MAARALGLDCMAKKRAQPHCTWLLRAPTAMCGVSTFSMLPLPIRAQSSTHAGSSAMSTASASASSSK